MRRPHGHNFTVTLALALLLLAAGCAQMRPPPAGVPAAERAAERAAEGDYAEAAQLYAEAAKRARGDERNRLRLAAGEAAARAGDAAAAGKYLDAVDNRKLDDMQLARLRLARTEAHIIGLPPDEALNALPPPEGGAPPELAARTWQLRANLLLRQGRIVAGVHALTQRDIWLVDPEQRRANDERIWQTLTNAAPEDLPPAALDRAGDTTRGWVALARIGAQAWPDRAALEDALINWERRHPGHPATRGILPERFDYTPIVPGEGFIARGGALALALPFTGRFAEPAAALRDGFLSAYYAGAPPRPRLHLYDTNAVPDMASLIERARADGVGLLVGPLDKDHVAELVQIEHPDMSILALNYLNSGSGQIENGFPGFYQFGLAPEDEAEAAAEQAVRLSLPRALALVPNSDWGARLLNAFRNALYDAGGEVVDYAFYNPGQQDHSAPIKRLLQYEEIVEEEDEAKDEEENSDENPAATADMAVDENGEPIEGGNAENAEDKEEDEDAFIERGRRQDADVIFIAAQPAQARLIRSQLRFYHALYLPVLATSHVFTGHVDRDRDTDLDGLMFPDMPWVLARAGDIAEQRTRVERLWPNAADRYPRLFALGRDAWRVQAGLRGGRVQSGRLLTGDTGELYLQPDGEIHRGLEWAYFRYGRPRPIPPLLLLPNPILEKVWSLPEPPAPAMPSPNEDLAPEPG